MRLLRKLRLRFRSLFQRSEVESELEAELRDYYESERESVLSADISPGEAEEVMARSRQGEERIKEECRDVRGTVWIEQAFRDLRYSFRLLCKDRLFTSVAVGTLALGIGANTTMFSVVNAVLLRPLPGYETDRLVRIIDYDLRYRAGFLPPALYQELSKQSHSFETIAGQQFCPFNLTGVGEPEQITGPCTSANWFALQQARAFLGRTFAPDEDQRGRARVVVLSYAFWQRKFHGSPQVIGRLVSLNGVPWTVIGIMPPEFQPLNVSDAPIFTPNVIADNPAGLIVMARLKPGVSIQTAQAEMKAVGDRLIRSEPSTWRGTDLTLSPALEQLTGTQRPLLLLLMGAVCFVLLIACVNVANLLLARSTARQHELHIRTALGASRKRIVQFLLAEVLLLCLAASLLAMGIAWGGIHLLRPLLASLPRAEEITIDGRVLGWALLMGWSATLLAGAWPALGSVATGGVAGMRSRVTPKGQTTLLTAEVALALVLLIGAGLLLRTFINLRSAPLGYEPSNTLTSFLALPPDRSQPASAELLYRRIRERLAALPGVQAVATATSTPTGGADMSVEVEPEGHTVHAGAATATVNLVSPQYFHVLGIRLKAGRSFTEADRQGGTPVVIVSDSIAQRYFGGHALGRRLHVPALNFALTDARMIWAEVVGVADSVVVTSIGQTTAEHIYLPEAQSPVRFTYLLVRTDRSPLPFASAVRHAVYQEAPLTPLDEMKSMEERSAYLTAAPRRAMWLLGLFASLAGVLSVLGIYAVSAYLTAQRTQEFAIRVAMGATAWSLARTVSRKPLEAILLGMTIGLIGAFGLTRFLQLFLFGISPVDLPTYAGMALLLLVCAYLALLRPTLRVISMNVSQTLRQD
jgi:predicted permease